MGLQVLMLSSAEISMIFNPPPTGENEGQEQAGAPSARHHQGVCDESGREDQGGHPGMEPDQHQTVGGFTQELHPGEFAEILKCFECVTDQLPLYHRVTIVSFRATLHNCFHMISVTVFAHEDLIFF